MPGRFFWNSAVILLGLTAVLSFAAPSPTVVGAYGTYPPSGPLEGKSPAAQAEYLRSLGVTLAGGIFDDDATPDALRAAGIRTMGLVVLFQGEQHWKSHPESRPTMADGEPLFQDRWYAGVCPNQEWLREAKLAEIEAMLGSGRYDVINLDFIRYPVHWEVPEPRIPDTCYGEVCLRKFQQDTGIEIPGELTSVPQKARFLNTQHQERWYRWRAEKITEFCRRVAALRDRIQPRTQISLAAIPWLPEDYDNAVYRVAGQDFRALAEVIDVFNPMSYHLLNERPVGWLGEVNEYFVRVTGRPVWPFVFFPEDAWLSQKMNAAEWVETFDEALSGGSTGLIAFPFARMPGTVGFEVFGERFGK